MVFIPTSINYTAIAAGQVGKIVSCENCQVKYFYLMERTAEAESKSFLFLDNAGAKKRAADSAQESLRETLMQEFDIVPCPHCGHYQSYMAPTVRWSHLAWLRVLGIFLLILAILVFSMYVLLSLSSSYTAEVLWRMRLCLMGAILLGVPAIGILATKFHLTRRYDHNNAEEREERLRLARSRCLTWEEFEKTMEPAIENAVKEMKSDELPDFLRRKKS